MWEWLVAIGTAFGAIFVAEFGDKTQLLALGLGARHSLRVVVAGLALGYGAAAAIAAAVGGLLGATLPKEPLQVAAGVLFLVFALRALMTDDDEDDATVKVQFGRHAVFAIALAIGIGEMGDKTQLATAALAAQANPVATWLGATAGEMTAGVLGAVAGRSIGSRLDRRVLRYASAAIFTIFGLAMLWSAI